MWYIKKIKYCFASHRIKNICSTNINVFDTSGWFTKHAYAFFFSTQGVSFGNTNFCFSSTLPSFFTINYLVVNFFKNFDVHS